MCEERELAIGSDVDNGGASTLFAAGILGGLEIIEIADEDVVFVEVADAALDAHDAIWVHVTILRNSASDGCDLFEMLEDGIVARSGRRDKKETKGNEQNRVRQRFCIRKSPSRCKYMKVTGQILIGITKREGLMRGRA